VRLGALARRVAAQRRREAGAGRCGGRRRLTRWRRVRARARFCASEGRQERRRREAVRVLRLGRGANACGPARARLRARHGRRGRDDAGGRRGRRAGHEARGRAQRALDQGRPRVLLRRALPQAVRRGAVVSEYNGWDRRVFRGYRSLVFSVSKSTYLRP
jgi:hypothetical protein